jgi:hypothetical protein
MKSIKNIFFLTFLIITFQRCKKSFLNLQPKDELTIATTFTTYDNIKTYAWQFYEVFHGYDGALQNIEFNDDLFENSLPNGESNWIWQRTIIPSSSTDYTQPFANIRAINIMLDNIDGAKISDADKVHWRSVGYFFKAFNYADLINKYGGVTWVEHSLLADNKSTLFGPRTSRDTVSQKVLDMLLYAEQNIKPAGDGLNTINVKVIRAEISRFGLFEGTWRKYHGLSNAEEYLRASATASIKLIQDFPNLHANYGEVFNIQSLAGVEGILLYKNYEKDQVTHVLSTWPKSSSASWDLTKKAADMYLMKDGQTRWTSPLFAGDKSPYTEMRNRDKRLLYTITPPYNVVAPGSGRTFTYTGNPADTEYFSVMQNLSPSGLQTLPNLNWNGFVVRGEPHFRDDNGGQGYDVTYTGYRFYKMSSKMNTGISSRDINDAPIFRMGEVLCNYAEVKFELGEFDQSIANETINKLRARGGVEPLNISSIPKDPTRDPTVDPVLWEIRRERAVELMGEGFRFDDLRRWKKMDYTSERKLGRWIVGSQHNNKIPILNGDSEGYISYLGLPPAPFPDYYYLYPIPSDQIVINPKIKQNPGW